MSDQTVGHVSCNLTKCRESDTGTCIFRRVYLSFNTYPAYMGMLASAIAAWYSVVDALEVLYSHMLELGVLIKLNSSRLT